MELRDSTKKFLDALATLCEIYGVTKISADDGGAIFTIGNGAVELDYCKPVNAKGFFFRIREENFMDEYRPQTGVKDNDT